MNSGGQGAILNQDSTPNSAANPATAGSIVSVFATGLGPTDPDLATGAAGASTEPLNRTVTAPDVIVGGIPTDVIYAGMAPGYAGMYQIVVRVPAGIPAANSVQLNVMSGGRISSNATIAVR